MPPPAAPLTAFDAGRHDPDDDSAATAPTLRLQVSALQAMCRQILGLRLVMTALSAPLALGGARPGPATWLVAAAVLATFMGGYAGFRDWERVGPLLLRHPWLLAADMLLGSLLLITATPRSGIAFVCLCTPLLAGLGYGWRVAALFAAAQGFLILLAEGAVPGPVSPATAVLLPGLCVVAGALGVTLRNLLLRFGAASEALTETRARLAVDRAVADERARLAREMHDSVAKTLHGVALAADGLAARAGDPRTDHAAVASQADLVARAARRAAAESRELLADLRRQSEQAATATDLTAELRAATEDFSRRGDPPAEFRLAGLSAQGAALPAVPHAVARQLTVIVGECLENARRHARASHVVVEAGLVPQTGLLRISVLDDGRGLPAGLDLRQLREAGHFGLVGVVERALSVGARIRLGRGRTDSGTEVRLDLPLAALTPAPSAAPAATPTQGDRP
ncbi:sensor histidine kinase [Streptomyces polyrhachis]|uniref:Sensor histidine kinase n=1 Tax=Streptomyces polyrhachis TaxID=1282885 RepID=A0ABW2GC32_9ACTN